MPVAKKKKAGKPAKKKAVDRGAELHDLAELSGRAEERYSYAMKIKEIQDDPTQVAINRMVVQMKRMAPFITDSDPEIQEFKREIQHKNLTYIAVRLFVACAKWDIRIANFKLAKNRCADCGKKVTK